MYLRARWYDPASGVFLSRDPFGGFATQPYSLHPYQYGYANPVVWTDASGRVVGVATLGGAVLLGGASLATAALIAAPVLLVGSVYAFNPDARRDLARGVDYVLVGGEGYVWRETLPLQAEIPDACTQSVDDVLVQAKGGKQKNENYVTQWAKAEAHKTGRDPCDILREAREQAIRDGNQKWFEDIVEAEKFLRCRNKAKRGRR